MGCFLVQTYRNFLFFVDANVGTLICIILKPYLPLIYWPAYSSTILSATVAPTRYAMACVCALIQSLACSFSRSFFLFHILCCRARSPGRKKTASKETQQTHLNKNGTTLISTTLNPCTPATRQSRSTHVSASPGRPILTVLHMCHMLFAVDWMYSCQARNILHQSHLSFVIKQAAD